MQTQYYTLSLSHATHSSQRVWNWWLGRGHEAYVRDNLGTATDRCALSNRQLDRIRWNWEEDRHMPPPQPYQPIRPRSVTWHSPFRHAYRRSLSALDFNPVDLLASTISHRNTTQIRPLKHSPNVCLSYTQSMLHRRDTPQEIRPLQTSNPSLPSLSHHNPAKQRGASGNPKRYRSHPNRKW